MNYADLLEVIGQDAMDAPGYCNTDLRNPGPFYWDWEDDVAKPRLERLGYFVIAWKDGERDSFGPLTRIAIVKRNQEVSGLIYG
jgi:hypothetical protein